MSGPPISETWDGEGYAAEMQIIRPVADLLLAAGLPVERASFVAGQVYVAVLEGVLASPLPPTELYHRGFEGFTGEGR